jgi:hypothetical protein
VGSGKNTKKVEKNKKLSKTPLTNREECGIIYRLSGRKAQEM